MTQPCLECLHNNNNDLGEESFMTSIANWKVFLAAVFLSGTGSLYMVNAPQLVSSLIEYWNFTSEQAAWATTTQTLGALLGMGLMLTMIEVVPLRRWLMISLIIIAAVEFIVAWQHSPEFFIGARLLAGIPAGILYAAGIALIGYLPQSERLFAISLIIAFITVALTTYFWTFFLDLLGFAGMFVWAGVSALLCLFFFRWIPEDTRTYQQQAGDQSYGIADLLKLEPVMILLAFILFYAGNMAIWNFSTQAGIALGMNLMEATETITITLFTGLLASILAAVLGMKVSYNLSFVIGLGGIAVSALMMLGLTDVNGYLLAFALFNFCFSFGIPYFQGLQARMDGSGRLLIAGLVASQLGLTIGPGVSALLVTETDFSGLYWFAFVSFVISLVLVLAVVYRVSSGSRHSLGQAA